jgi:hypothetical protein
MRLQCQRCRKSFTASRTDARYCGPRCRTAAHRQRHIRISRPRWSGRVPNLRDEKSELAAHLLRIADRDDDGEAKTGRRYYYLAFSHGYVAPDMSDTPAGKKSRDAAYHKVLDVLGVLRMRGDLPWSMVLDLTRELDQWETYASSREARAALRASYDEDRWHGQRYYPLLIVEKDTLEPVCRPIAERWQIPFASSRGYSSLTLQHEVACLLRARQAQHGQDGLVYFVSDLDPSGLDLQRAWQEALENFGLYCFLRAREATSLARLDRIDVDRALRCPAPVDRLRSQPSGYEHDLTAGMTPRQILIGLAYIGQMIDLGDRDL